MDGDNIFDYRIFMNNVLNYRGYRFFQSSYDSDEKGTILSVNKDKAGTIVTYIGYLCLLLSVISLVVFRFSRFNILSRNINKNNFMFLRLLFILSLFICYLGQSIESDFFFR